MTSRASIFSPPDSLRSRKKVWAATGSLTSCCHAGWDVKGMESFRALPSRGSLCLPRSTRAFLAPRPFSAVAATTAAMFRSHPPSLSSPSGIVVCVRGLPRAFRPAYRSETTFPRSRRSGPGRTTPPRRPRRRARSLVSLQLGAESCLGSPATPRPGHPCSALSLAAQSVYLRRYWPGCRRSFGRESPTPTSSREEGLEFRVVAQS